MAGQHPLPLTLLSFLQGKAWQSVSTSLPLVSAQFGNATWHTLCSAWTTGRHKLHKRPVKWNSWDVVPCRGRGAGFINPNLMIRVWSSLWNVPNISDGRGRSSSNNSAQLSPPPTPPSTAAAAAASAVQSPWCDQKRPWIVVWHQLSPAMISHPPYLRLLPYCCPGSTLK